MNNRYYFSPAKPISIFCEHPDCERRLVLPEEWQTGLCTRHADPATPSHEDDDPLWHEMLKRIDALLDEAPTGVISRPNRLA